MNISATELPNFIRKYYLLHELLILKYMTTKYFSFQYSVTYCSQALRRSAHRAREAVHRLIQTRETPDFITPALWPAYSPDLNPFATRFGGSCRSVCTAATWRRPAEVAPDRRVRTFPPGGHRWSGQAVASTYSSLRSTSSIVDIQGGPKMAQFLLNALTLSNINRFSKFFRCQNQEKICNNIIAKDPTTPQVCRYTLPCEMSVS